MFIFRQLYDAESSTYTYLLGDPQTKECLLIDPVWDQVDRDLQIISEMGLELVLGVNTHCHADHVTGTGLIKSRLPRVRSMIAKASGALADEYLEPNQTFKVGNLKFVALATPGHTAGCMSFYFEQGGMVFTGDALLIRGSGRTDFQGGDAGVLYDGIHNVLYKLPPETLVYPAHDYKGRTCSSIGEEIAHNPRFTKTKADFIDFMSKLGLAYPKKIDMSLPANLKCGIDFELPPKI